MSKTFSKMNKTELMSAIEKYGLQDKIEGKEPTNNELITILDKYKADMDGASKVSTEAKKEVVKPTTSKGKKMGIAETIEYLNTALPYIVVDHDSTYTVKDDEEERVIEISWGNSVIGKTREKIALHGLRQLVTRGALKNMKTMTIPRVKVDKDTGAVTQLKPRARFSLTPAEGYTDEQIQALKTKQRQAVTADD